MSPFPHVFQFLVVAVAGWINQQPRDVIDSLSRKRIASSESRAVLAVLAPFAVDQAADLCSCGHENDDSAAGLVCMS